MMDRFRWPTCVIIVALACALALPGDTGPVSADSRPLYLPLVFKHHVLPSGITLQVAGHARLERRTDHSGVTLKVNGVAVTQTDSAGHFAFSWHSPQMEAQTITLTAHSPLYLWAQKVLTVTESRSLTLADVWLLGGDVAGPDSTVVDVPGDCPSPEPVLVAGPPDGAINGYDVTFVNRHVGTNSEDHTCGPEDSCWEPQPCYPGVPHLGQRADINGDGRVDSDDQQYVYDNHGKSAPLVWPE